MLERFLLSQSFIFSSKKVFKGEVQYTAQYTVLYTVLYTVHWKFCETMPARGSELFYQDLPLRHYKTKMEMRQGKLSMIIKLNKIFLAKKTTFTRLVKGGVVVYSAWTVCPVSRPPVPGSNLRPGLSTARAV